MNEIDGYPETSWVRVRVLPQGVSGAARMKRWLKLGLRSYGLKCEVLTGEPPCDESAGESIVAQAKGIHADNV